GVRDVALELLGLLNASDGGGSGSEILTDTAVPSHHVDADALEVWPFHVEVVAGVVLDGRLDVCDLDALRQASDELESDWLKFTGARLCDSADRTLLCAAWLLGRCSTREDEDGTA